MDKANRRKDATFGTPDSVFPVSVKSPAETEDLLRSSGSVFEQDYLMRMMVALAEAIRRSMEKARGDRDPAEAAQMIENAISHATDLDGAVLLSLSPESIASVLQVSGTDPAIMEYLSRSLLLESDYLTEAGNHDLAQLREAQAYALSEAYGFELSQEAVTKEALDEFLVDENADL